MEILTLVLEVLVPVAFEILSEIFLFLPWARRGRHHRYIVYGSTFVIAVVLGIFSSMLFESRLAHNRELAAAVLFVVPLVGGLTITKIAQAIFTRKRDQVRYGHFWLHFLALFGFLGGRLFHPFG